MFDAVLLIVLARPRAAGLGPDFEADLTIDVDPTICQTYGAAKQGARFGYTTCGLPPAAGYATPGA